jgi:uncharacterized LabA/DUF88 family protein
MSIATAQLAGTTVTLPLRIRVFIDFWNLQILLNEREGKATSNPAAKFMIDWRELPEAMVGKAVSLLKVPSHTYDGTTVFTSFDPKTLGGGKYRRWVHGWLDSQPGINVVCLERRRKHPPKCQACHQEIESCPHCKVGLAGTTEKGVDTAIATAMMRLAWEKAYDVAVLVSSDGDLVPAVELLSLKGTRVIQAGFPPHGSHLARACWASFDLFSCREDFRDKNKR